MKHSLPFMNSSIKLLSSTGNRKYKNLISCSLLLISIKDMVGRREQEREPVGSYDPFPVAASGIDCIVLTHIGGVLRPQL